MYHFRSDCACVISVGGGTVGIDRKLDATGKRSVRFTPCANKCLSLFNISFIFWSLNNYDLLYLWRKLEMWERILVDEIIKATYLNLLYQLGFFPLESCMHGAFNSGNLRKNYSFSELLLHGQQSLIKKMIKERKMDNLRYRRHHWLVRRQIKFLKNCDQNLRKTECQGKQLIIIL